MGKAEWLSRKFNLQTVQECNKSHVELIVFFVHPKDSNHAPLITVDYAWKTKSSHTKYPGTNLEAEREATIKNHREA